MTDCTRADMRDLLPEVMHGTLDAHRRAEVEHHVAMCASCANELALLRSMRAALGNAPVVDELRIAAAVNAARSVTPVRPRAATSRAGWRADWRVAAAIALLAVGGGSYALARASRTGVWSAGARLAARSTRDSGTTHRSQPAPPNAAPVRTSSTLVAATAAPPTTGLMFDGGVNDLSTADIKSLLDAMNHMDAVPAVDPAPVLDPSGEDIL